MRVCGFSFVRNALENDYPVVEAVRSVLPLCDEFQLVVADSTDGTLEYLRGELKDPRVVLSTAPWDESLRTGGGILARLTNAARSRARGDWGVYVQADEAVHERYHPAIRACMEHYLEDNDIQGLLFRFRRRVHERCVVILASAWRLTGACSSSASATSTAATGPSTPAANGTGAR